MSTTSLPDERPCHCSLTYRLMAHILPAPVSPRPSAVAALGPRPSTARAVPRAPRQTTASRLARPPAADPVHHASIYRGVPHRRRVSFGIPRCLIRDRAISEVSLLPLRIPIDDPRPVILDTAEGRDIVEVAQAVSEEFGTQLQTREKDLLLLEASRAAVAAS